MTESPVIRLTDLSKRFGTLAAVDDISLEIGRGEVVALLGPNGAGKSTTIDLALGLATPSSGTAELFGGTPRAAIVGGRVGAMLQGGALLPTMTVAQSVALVAAAHNHPLPVAEALERARVTDIARQRVSSLSGGQLQRARFAVAVVSNPQLLILDEPTAAMDVEARHVFWESMREFTSQGRTVVFATHYLDEADSFADRIVILSRGRVVADDAPAEIKAVVTGRVVAFTLDNGTADVRAVLEALPGVHAVDHRAGRFSVRTDDSDGVLRTVLATWPRIHDIEVVARTMDDAFLALTSTKETVR
ncbi:ABC transporter ATP-binding protein [Compostimonas suwonensis]|uniref:ABC-2 type transport system ATP-binding protein n=1 Tax=Compostimonas suwonensis TaxID=1048394 RepID=A0A2M9BU27_9MICO|nr:ABC transporter ATP-binding protein [Compostimonas suwonensis]PJJ61422.1 ABC-2 type transport system ATP-binding protein [Compostimonas suwonensis]